LSGNNNNGTLTNGPIYNSSNKGSIVFDGIDEYVSFSSTNLGNEITLMCFVRPSNTFGAGGWLQTIFSNSAGGGATNGLRFLYNNFLSDTRNIVISVGNGTSSGGSSMTTTSKIIYDSWQHITYVVNKNTNNAKIYYNGKLEVSATPDVNNYNTNGAFRLGLFTDNQYPLKGSIANYMIYTKELSSFQILQNYNALKGRFGL
jgi:hypothetical protein